MNAPILLFVYNRPEHTKATVEALKAADGANETPLVIFSDAAKTQADNDNVGKVRDYIHGIDGFAKIEIRERDKNAGLAQSIIEGVSEEIGKYGRVVVLEDDLVVTKYFIRYMNSALNFYEGRGVFGISGYTPNVDIPIDYPFSTYMIHRNCSWGWATWKSKWESIDWSVRNFASFIHDTKKCASFNESGSDLTMMLLRQQRGEIQSWSIRYCYEAFMRGEPTVYPTRSMVRNGGVDGSGTNMKSSSRYDTRTADYISCQAFAPGVAVDQQILKSFRKTYDCSFYRRTINWWKLMLYRIGH